MYLENYCQVRWHQPLNGHETEQTLGDSGVGKAWHAAVHGATKSWTRLSNRTTTTSINRNVPQNVCMIRKLKNYECKICPRSKYQFPFKPLLANLHGEH